MGIPPTGLFYILMKLLRTFAYAIIFFAAAAAPLSASAAEPCDSASVASGVGSDSGGLIFRKDRTNNLLLVILIAFGFIYTLTRARKYHLFIRRVPALDVIEDAVGAAAETNRAIFYFTGIGSISNMDTIASLSLLGQVAKSSAVCRTQLKVLHSNPLVLPVADAVVKNAYEDAGRFDMYKQDINIFVSNDRLSYAATADGMIAREKPAVCFYMGCFMAECLLMSEVGAANGAVQIGGTGSISQIPFIFASCDYTLIGEELYAAGAYLSKDPVLMATIKLQDYVKAFVITVLILGCALTAAASAFGWENTVGLWKIFSAK